MRFFFSLRKIEGTYAFSKLVSYCLTSFCRNRHISFLKSILSKFERSSFVWFCFLIVLREIFARSSISMDAPPGTVWRIHSSDIISFQLFECFLVAHSEKESFSLLRSVVIFLPTSWSQSLLQDLWNMCCPLVLIVTIVTVSELGFAVALVLVWFVSSSWAPLPIPNFDCYFENFSRQTTST